MSQYRLSRQVRGCVCAGGRHERLVPYAVLARVMRRWRYRHSAGVRVRRRRRPTGMMPRDARCRYKDSAMGAIERCSKLLQARLHSLWSRAPSLITHPPHNVALVQRIRIRPLHRDRHQPRCRGVFLSAAAD